MRSLQTRIPAAGFLLLVATGSTWALSMENAQEQSCFEIKDPVAVDLSWVLTVLFFNQAGSCVFLYRCATCFIFS